VLALVVVAGFAAGALFGVAQHLLAKKAFFGRARTGFVALYIMQLLILSFGLLLLVFLLWKEALLPTTIGMIATSIILAVITNLKR
jgi:hypothetical protein